MAGVRRLEHVGLQVNDLERAVEFYTNTVGLVEYERDDDTVYLGCGLDKNFDLAVVEGGTGVEHFAIRAAENQFEQYLDQLDEHGVDTSRTDGMEPGQQKGVRFDLPAETLSMEIVTTEDARYHNPADVGSLSTSAAVNEARSPVTPVDLSHITAMTPDPEGDVEFLRDVLEFRVSDIGVTPDGEWVMAFTRAGDYHHDVALFDDPDDTLHHLAWEMKDLSHIKEFADHHAAEGNRFEIGPVRHGPGSNIAAYFQEPGGNRFEITTEVETVVPDAEPETHLASEVPFCVWSETTPSKSFHEGS